MRLTTLIYAKFESKGRPGDALIVEAKSVGVVMQRLLEWVRDVPMGHYIRVTFARSEADLHKYAGDGHQTNSKIQSDLLAEDFIQALDTMLAIDSQDADGSETGTLETDSAATAVGEKSATFRVEQLKHGGSTVCKNCGLPFEKHQRLLYDNPLEESFVCPAPHLTLFQEM